MRRPAPRSRATAVVATVALVCPLALGGCSAESLGRSPGAVTSPDLPRATPGASDTSDADFAAIDDLLRVRARALLRGDRAAFLATLDPGNRPLRTQQEVVFDNLQRLPVDRVYYGTSRSGLPPARVAGADPVLRPDVHEHVELGRVMLRPVSNQVSMTFVERDGRWLLGAELLDPDFAAQERPWFGVPIEAAADGQLLVLTDRGAAVPATELLARTRQALAGVVEVLDEDGKKDGDEPLIVDATSNGAPEQVDQSAEEAGAVTTTLLAYDRDGKDLVGRAGKLVKANPGDVHQLVEDTRTLRHELTHVVLDGYGSTNPLWVTEGLAEYVGSYPSLLARSRTSDLDLLRAISRREVELTPAGAWGADPVLDYLSAEAFAEHLVTRYGIGDYLEMMDLFARLGQRRGVILGQGLEDEVLDRVYGESADSVARAGFALLAGLAD